MFEPTGKVPFSMNLGNLRLLTPSLAVVAFKRCVDHVHLAIDMEFVRGFGEHLGSLLSRELGVLGGDAEQKCRKYLAEPEGVANERRELNAKLERLESARDAIEDWRVNGV